MQEDRVGYNVKLVKEKNRKTALNLIATKHRMSRTEIAAEMGLTRAAAGKMVADLLEEGLVCEVENEEEQSVRSVGRMPVNLSLSSNAPCIFGILIRRSVLSFALSDLGGNVIDRKDRSYSKNEITEERLVSMVIEGYDELMGRNSRKVIGIGIASAGPIDAEEGMILDPPNFYGIKNIPICKKLEEHTGLPCYIINDSNAGALAEKMYGIAKNIKDFIYVNIMNGIGSGCILDHQIYTGSRGECSEIGHTSINAWGAKCSCGNVGCLEQYANVENMNRKIRKMRSLSTGVKLRSAAWLETDQEYEFTEILKAAEAGDMCAIAAVEEFAEYLSVALTNMLNILNLNTVVLGYENNQKHSVLAEVLGSKINESAICAKKNKISVMKTRFQGDAPLYGAIALIADHVFKGSIVL